jgi:hypothetical protein
MAESPIIATLGAKRDPIEGPIDHLENRVKEARTDLAMNRAIELRLRKLEANAPAKRVRRVWTDTSDLAEWDREIARVIASGRSERLHMGVPVTFLSTFGDTDVRDSALPPNARRLRTS